MLSFTAADGPIVLHVRSDVPTFGPILCMFEPQGGAVTVSAVQIIAAQAQGLINVTGLAAACDKLKFPFYLAATIMERESGGQNIFGHDAGGSFSGPITVKIPVTEARYKTFLAEIGAGKTSNGVGPMQLTYRGYHIGPVSMQARGFNAWVPADNIRYGVEILSRSLKTQLATGLSLEKAFWNVAKIYNAGKLEGLGGVDYANGAAASAKTWAATVGTSDMEDPMAERIPFRGAGLTCSCVVESLPWVEEAMRRRGIIRESIDCLQFGYRDDVSASAGTHARGGCTDVAQRSAAAIDVWRRWGWTMQDRSPWFPTMPHAHGWPYGCPHLSDAAKDQRTDWDNRRNGLVNNEPVIGRWPVDKWDVALERMVPTLFTAEDIAKATVAEEIRRGQELGEAIGKGFARGFLRADDIIAAGKDETNAANTHQIPATFITNDHDLLVDIRAALQKLTPPSA
jgi:hypothetical protein